ncbi:MAG: tRNA uridine-5-carboxymethylaminomethyl(34) synthesis GTPase MnmE [Prevotella sp.]|nr:tRNA uridine-5-carboxymethylaminomethyl(34) synthesis GTPase MnmE [Prevotella sp.]
MNTLASVQDTICALSTAPGGAIGIIRVSGPAALSAASAICSVRCDSAAANTIHYTHITDGSEVIDEAMVSIFRSPHSYTGEDSVEFSCHGSRYILNKVLELLVRNGCRMARPGEFTQRAYLNGKMDLAQAEAVADLIASTNQASHHLAMSQLRGGITTELSRLRDHLLRLTSLLELELDFSDHEDLEFASRTELLQLAQTIDTHIARLCASFETGNALKNGIPVAIVGAPNVGKSTLLNALLGEERAIVSDIQGTTRDAIEDTIDIGGVTFRFIDTAGIRHTADAIEQMGIERSVAAARKARIIIMMTEPGVAYPDIPVMDHQTVIRIENKTPAFQAKSGIGLDGLRQQLMAAIPSVSDSDIIVTSARHHEALLRARQSLCRVIDGLNDGLSGDLLSEDLRQTLDILAEITGGQITPQETLNNIFSHFCVGK